MNEDEELDTAQLDPLIDMLEKTWEAATESRTLTPEIRRILIGRREIVKLASVSAAHKANIKMQKLAKEKGTFFPWQIVPVRRRRGAGFGEGRLGDDFILAPINDHVISKIIGSMVDYGVFVKEVHGEEAQSLKDRGLKYPEPWKSEFLQWANKRGKFKVTGQQKKMKKEKLQIQNITEGGTFSTDAVTSAVTTPFAYTETEYNKMLKTMGRGGKYSSIAAMRKALKPRQLAEAQARLSITSDDEARKLLINAPEFLSGSPISYLSESQEDKEIIADILKEGADMFWSTLDRTFTAENFQGMIDVSGLFPDGGLHADLKSIETKLKEDLKEMFPTTERKKKPVKGTAAKFPNIDAIRNWFHAKKHNKPSPKDKYVSKNQKSFESLDYNQKWNELERIVFLIADSIYEKQTGKSKKSKGKRRGRRTDITGSASYKAQRREHDHVYKQAELDEKRRVRREYQRNRGDRRYGGRSKRWKRES